MAGPAALARVATSDRKVARVTAPADVAMRDAAVDVLCDASLADVVDFVAYVDDDAIVVANSEGASRLSRTDPDAGAEVVRGRDPVAWQDPLAFSSLVEALADPSPPNARNSYP